jgi:hypothetical protein
VGYPLREPIEDVIHLADAVEVWCPALPVAVAIPAAIVDEDVQVVVVQKDAHLDGFGIQLCGEAIEF